MFHQDNQQLSLKEEYMGIKESSETKSFETEKCQASIYEALGIPQELNGGNWELLSKPRGLRWKVRHFLLMRRLRKIGEDIVQKVEE